MEQTEGPMHGNWIRGIRCWASWHLTTKSKFIRGSSRKSGGWERRTVELTSGDLPFALDSRLRVVEILTSRTLILGARESGQVGEKTRFAPNSSMASS